MRRAFSWIGVLLFVGSAIWFYVGSETSSPRLSRTHPADRPAPAGTLVVLDPGHGGGDSGAICGGVLEKDLTLDVAQRAERLLLRAGLRTLMTRSDDRYVSLPGRAEIANRQGDCLFVSIHFNDAKPAAATGVETYYAARQIEKSPAAWSWLPFAQPVKTEAAASESQSLAGLIQNALVERTRAVNRGTKPEQFYVIANVCHPAVLVEGGFITNKSDASKLADGRYRESIASAICEGVRQFREMSVPRNPTFAMSGLTAE